MVGRRDLGPLHRVAEVLRDAALARVRDAARQRAEALTRAAELDSRRRANAVIAADALDPVLRSAAERHEALLAGLHTNTAQRSALASAAWSEARDEAARAVGRLAAIETVAARLEFAAKRSRRAG